MKPQHGYHMYDVGEHSQTNNPEKCAFCKELSGLTIAERVLSMRNGGMTNGDVDAIIEAVHQMEKYHLDNLTEKQEDERGALIGHVLGVRRSTLATSTDWKTKSGSRTDRGLFRLVKRLMLDGAES